MLGWNIKVEKIKIQKEAKQSTTSLPLPASPKVKVKLINLVLRAFVNESENCASNTVHAACESKS